ncbi:MAG: AmmeMemoRadiSam system protein B, partial [Gammaproteobacteria bacterium]
MSTRAAAVAGYFYEADPGRLQHHVDKLLSAASAQSRAFPRALIVPHAGYIYSGPTAARAYKCLLTDPGHVKRVLLIGPAHREYVDGMAIPSVERFSTPLGDIPLDREALDRIGDLPGVEVSDEAHRQEHSLEVQLPFLQSVLGNFSLVPIVVGGASAKQVAAVIDMLVTDTGTLVVVSSDLSHFHEYREAQRIDSTTCERILARSTTLVGEEACGARAINGLMASQIVDGLEIELLDACNSGDTAGT